MEKYMFDCRLRMDTSPKFLNRNERLGKSPCTPKTTHFKEKGLTMSDFTYYQHLGTPVSGKGNRLNNLSTLMDETTDAGSNIHHEKDLCFDNPKKWVRGDTLEKGRSLTLKKKTTHKRLTSSQFMKTMPCVGDYRC